MGKDHLDHADVDAEGYRAGTLIGALATILDQLVSIEVTYLLLAEVALECRKGSFLAAAGWFPYRTHIGYMKVNQVTEGVQTRDGRSVGGKPLIDERLSLPGPFLRVVPTQESLARVAAFPSDLDPVCAGWKLGD